MINCDDLGYGDISSYGSVNRTPNIDSLGTDGIRLTHFYSASAVCSPSRAALLTGRYPARVGVPGVIDANDPGGLAAAETTLGQVLKAGGYSTMCIGKWHLGSQPQYLPTNRGFDQYFGIPYSHDMYPRILLRNTEVVEQNAQLDSLTRRFTNEAVRFIGDNRSSPFFLYFAQPFPHIPLAVSQPFRGKSGHGMYGDVIAELDWSVGEVLHALRDNGLEQNTLVIFTSDNGPWYQGSAGRLRGRKGESYEGGVRVPFLARLPGRIPAGLESNAVTSTMDLLPTLANLTGSPLPGKPLDGIDIWWLLSGMSPALDREALLYFDWYNVQCARLGQWKLHLSRYNSKAYSPDPFGGRVNLPLPKPELYDVVSDPDESFDVADDNPDIVADIRARVERMLPGFPDPVAEIYRTTMARSVENTPAGALTLKKGG